MMCLVSVSTSTLDLAPICAGDLSTDAKHLEEQLCEMFEVATMVMASMEEGEI